MGVSGHSLVEVTYQVKAENSPEKYSAVWAVIVLVCEKGNDCSSIYSMLLYTLYTIMRERFEVRKYKLCIAQVY